MSREVHAGICESRRVKLPPVTRHHQGRRPAPEPSRHVAERRAYPGYGIIECLHPSR